ncbi:hypothetical protein BSPWISOXPB_510 [uncultured Gammaproteobacteria bacterium]|jgi:hypothetical protein|nr:hypothetical protein BSPWISOXPB_510 [uncultured Gammaproteobacteria bacterium]
MTSKNNHKTGVSFAQESEREEICKLARQDHDESFFLAQFLLAKINLTNFLRPLHK